MNWEKFNKITHRIAYWTNPFYMIGYDLCKNHPEFVMEHFGFIIKPMLKLFMRIDKMIGKFLDK